MSRTLRIGAVVLLVQAALIAVYWRVEDQRSQNAPGALGTAPPQHVSGPLPALSLTTRDGTRRELQAERRTLVHFWATWCPPCRVELPGLLALSRTEHVDVVAIALDDDWSEVDRFLGGHPAANVFLGEPTRARSALDVDTLPVTFLVEAGQIRLRFDGARDWSNPAFASTWVGPIPSPPPPSSPARLD